MYVDGIILLIIYAMASVALLISVHNYFYYKEIKEALQKKKQTRIIRPVIKNKQTGKSPWRW